MHSEKDLRSASVSKKRKKTVELKKNKKPLERKEKHFVLTFKSFSISTE